VRERRDHATIRLHHGAFLQTHGDDPGKPRVFTSDRADAFIRSFLAFSHGRVISSEAHASGAEIGRPKDMHRRVRIESKFGKLSVLVTDGHIPYPY